ncbi:MAG: 30S ribosomal protein S9 [Candidatus Vogelbacteria bacterium RIFOXYD1_FULL_44_32]|uniref:Small ribosomal subunit protein uS9 n=1 Tax=Candidatus Vogelbacteria bacterium RIFOXYD1_FULL_44_32 TaxID=1802438 RepID=A0A1G2QEX4_9BACT|nr:MAG: 30S ribosomal protein S9 [Candidatus Vogelbacteria bacterium RIFOXYD1_FULL_44_32]
MATETTKNKYIEAVGRRKTAVVRVRLTAASKSSYIVNGKPLTTYFPVKELQVIVQKPMIDAATKDYSVSIVARGGGIHAQAEGAAMGIARALTKADALLRLPLKKAGHLTRDPRAKERRKFGLKKARKAPQWSKR